MEKIERTHPLNVRGYIGVGNVVVKESDLDRLEAENQEMLEALKAICIEVETSDESDISDYAYVKAVNLIEKATGKTWEQIKDSER